MTDPKRWADDAGDATAFERELFRSGRAAVLPAEEKRRRWLAIAEQAALLPAAAIPHGLTGKAAAKGIASASWLKALALLPVLAGAGAGAYALTHSAPSHSTSVPTNHSATRAAVIPTGAPAEPDEHRIFPDVPAPSHDERVISATRTSAAKGTTAGHPRDRGAPPAAEATESTGGPRVAEVTRASRLAEEARAVLDARNALRSGNLSSALGILDDARARFSDGSLGQEREALTIEALARAGRKQAATMHARAFLARFPNSPLASNVRRYE